MPPPTRRSLDGFLAIGPHSLDAQLAAITAYAERNRYTLEVFWAILPGEDPAAAAPDFGVPIVVFDDEIARFTTEEYQTPCEASGDGAPASATTDWHVAHPLPQPKRPTEHLPVYGFVEGDDLAADAILCIGSGSLDRQVDLLEAYAIRSGLRLQGIYLANCPGNLDVLLRDFDASRRLRGAGVTLTIDEHDCVRLHD